MKVKVISLPYIFQVLYVLCFTRPRYQVSVYRTIGPLVRFARASSHVKNMFWSIENYGEVLSKLKSEGFNATSLSTYDFSNL